MIKIEIIGVWGFEGAIRGMRNPLNSWERSDSMLCTDVHPNDCRYAEYCQDGGFCVGSADLNLMRKLFRAGSEHRKYIRMIHVQMDVIAPLYWWKEFDTYKIGTVANSCSTMHKIADKEFEIEDFSVDHLNCGSMHLLYGLIKCLNVYRNDYIESGEKTDWWQMIQLLPTSYNQRRTLDFNYETAVNILHQRQGHKLDEWKGFCDSLLELPYLKEVVDG